MAAPKFSVLTLFLFCLSAHSQSQQNIKVENLIDGCFTFQNIALDTTKEPVLSTASIKTKTENTDCPCKSTYPHDGGGGISEIKQTQTNVFVVLIAQEERIDQLTYELSIDDSCKVALVKKEESTISFGR